MGLDLATAPRLLRVAVVAVALALGACDNKATDSLRAASPQTAASAASDALAACSGCHGSAGEGNAAAGFPRLAGQPKTFLLHQLESFANGTRSSDVMSAIAHSLAPDQRAETAARFARLVDSPPAISRGDAPTSRARVADGDLTRGRTLAEEGDSAKQVQACKNCHGPEGGGLGMQLPYLAGQPASYLASATNAYRAGRRSDPTGQMPVIASLLGDDDVRALATYYASLPAPAKPLDVPQTR